MIQVKLRRNADKRLKKGHLWVFSNEIESVSGEVFPGCVATLFDQRGEQIGVGFYHPHSLIAFRVLAEAGEVIDAEFYLKKISQAYTMRQQLRAGAQAVRVVHGESDGLPGLLIDLIGKVVSIQVVSAGIEHHLDWIIEACKTVLSPEWIILRNDAGLRKLEGLPEYVRLAHGSDEIPIQTITEHGVTYQIDIQQGQKTGFYIDQHENRRTFAAFVRPGDHVLDAFCNDGGFALQAARVGAASVLGLDISEAAIERAKANATLNATSERTTFEKADLMRWLPEQAATSATRYDVINLDPPGFAKNRKTAAAALKGYQKIHESAMKLLKDGGYLATATCSHHIETQRFLDTVRDAAYRTGRQILLVHRGSQPVDHPVLLGMPETEYLRFFVFRVTHTLIR
jgi:23S rRNA (cytosine1962-C5)-methyltransferase